MGYYGFFFIVSIPSFKYLSSMFYKQCSGRICNREDLKNTLDLNAIADEYVSYKKKLDASADELKRLCLRLGIDC